MKVRNTKRKMLFLFILYIVLGGILINSVVYTTYEIATKQIEKKKYKSQLAELKEKEEELNATVAKLQNPDYVARYAREKYLYSKDGEIIIRIPE